MKTWLLHIVLSWLAGITAEQLEKVFQRVLDAQATVPGEGKGAERRAWVLKQIADLKLVSWAANLAVEVAHALAKKKGLI